MGNVGILKSQLFIVLVFVFSLGLITIAVASPPGEGELRDNYHKRMITRNRAAVSAPGTIRTCSGCDSANNDWESVAREPVDIYSVGVDTYFGRKAYFTTYYSLSAGKGNVFSRPLGDPTITTGPNQFALNGTNSATNYPEVNRTHEIVVVFRYKLTERLAPKIEYHYQQWDYKDYQTSPMPSTWDASARFPMDLRLRNPRAIAVFDMKQLQVRRRTGAKPTAR